MRRTDREITNRDEIIDVLKRSNTIRLGIHAEPFPYVVPLSFGFEDTGDEIHIYFHGAREGFKHSLLDKNRHVCVEADIFHRYAETEAGLTTEYESIIGFGLAETVEDEEAVKGMDLVCSHCGYHGYVYDTRALKFMRIYKITLSSITGKRRFV
jgi:nitroimidazol reductase NimA-like FMN-containing flavoprotein (pyridoxamine 5'-phosphate oxidase superfamily)